MHPGRPGASVVIATAKEGGLYAYSLTGAVLQHVPAEPPPGPDHEPGRLNNVDLVHGPRRRAVRAAPRPRRDLLGHRRRGRAARPRPRFAPRRRPLRPALRPVLHGRIRGPRGVELPCLPRAALRRPQPHRLLPGAGHDRGTRAARCVRRTPRPARRVPPHGRRRGPHLGVRSKPRRVTPSQGA
ncbi:hypothetical protein [Nonomuraea cypriaca]|uniref:hypothetical protein n=1 Tax=Nonomuraea cypriaca TaxID=1187855 RepID=UPI002E298C91|nr:hypothetical protein [Nonomuraea cypriaca]